jgi:hypothetical protein
MHVPCCRHRYPPLAVVTNSYNAHQIEAGSDEQLEMIAHVALLTPEKRWIDTRSLALMALRDEASSVSTVAPGSGNPKPPTVTPPIIAEDPVNYEKLAAFVGALRVVHRVHTPFPSLLMDADTKRTDRGYRPPALEKRKKSRGSKFQVNKLNVTEAHGDVGSDSDEEIISPSAIVLIPVANAEDLFPTMEAVWESETGDAQADAGDSYDAYLHSSNHFPSKRRGLEALFATPILSSRHLMNRGSTSQIEDGISVPEDSFESLLAGLIDHTQKQVKRLEKKRTSTNNSSQYWLFNSTIDRFASLSPSLADKDQIIEAHLTPSKSAAVEGKEMSPTDHFTEHFGEYLPPIALTHTVLRLVMSSPHSVLLHLPDLERLLDLWSSLFKPLSIEFRANLLNISKSQAHMLAQKHGFPDGKSMRHFVLGVCDLITLLLVMKVNKNMIQFAAMEEKTHGSVSDLFSFDSYRRLKLCKFKYIPLQFNPLAHDLVVTDATSSSASVPMLTSFGAYVNVDIALSVCLCQGRLEAASQVLTIAGKQPSMGLASRCIESILSKSHTLGKHVDVQLLFEAVARGLGKDFSMFYCLFVDCLPSVQDHWPSLAMDILLALFPYATPFHALRVMKTQSGQELDGIVGGRQKCLYDYLAALLSTESYLRLLLSSSPPANILLVRQFIDVRVAMVRSASSSSINVDNLMDNLHSLLLASTSEDEYCKELQHILTRLLASHDSSAALSLLRGAVTSGAQIASSDSIRRYAQSGMSLSSTAMDSIANQLLGHKDGVERTRSCNRYQVLCESLCDLLSQLTSQIVSAAASELAQVAELLFKAVLLGVVNSRYMHNDAGVATLDGVSELISHFIANLFDSMLVRACPSAADPIARQQCLEELAATELKLVMSLENLGHTGDTESACDLLLSLPFFVENSTSGILQQYFN